MIFQSVLHPFVLFTLATSSIRVKVWAEKNKASLLAASRVYKLIPPIVTRKGGHTRELHTSSPSDFSSKLLP